MESIAKPISMNEIKEGDFLLIKLTSGISKQNIPKLFIAQTISNEKNDVNLNIINVRFLRQYRQTRDIFVFPEVADESIVYDTEIMGKVKTKTLRHGKIQIF